MLVHVEAKESPVLTDVPVPTFMNTYQWLLVLGFPIEVAAAKAMPELFTDDEAGSPA